MDEDRINEILQEEKKLLKDNRVYLVLELNKEDTETFSRFCLDTTANDPKTEPNICQVIGRGLTDIISNDVESLLDLGYQALERDDRKVGGNVVSLDSYRPEEDQGEEDE